MWDRFVPSLWLLAEGEADPANPWQFLAGPWIPFILIGFLFYFVLIQPERKKRAEMAKMLDQLKKNDHVVTIGGIFGVVLNVEKGSDEVLIRVDENNNTRLRVLRSSISRVLTEVKGDDKKEGS